MNRKRKTSNAVQSWVNYHLRQRQNLVLIKHLVEHHAQGDECECCTAAQSICDQMRWDGVRLERDYYYQSAAREYPRFMRLRPELDHAKYTRLVLQTRDMDKCLLHFSAHRGRLPADVILQELLARAASCTSADAEAVRVSAGARKRALSKQDENTLEQVREFLDAHETAFSIMEVHEI
jgi:hypothetical protein